MLTGYLRFVVTDASRNRRRPDVERDGFEVTHEFECVPAADAAQAAVVARHTAKGQVVFPEMGPVVDDGDAGFE